MTRFRIVLVRIFLAASFLLLAACGSPETPVSGDAGSVKPLIKYSYTGPPMTVITGVFPPWTTESRITGYFVTEELPPATTTDFLDPDIVWPFPNIPATFAFSDGARTISRDNLEDVSKDTGRRIDPNKYEVRTFWVTTDVDGEIVAWDMLFVHDVRRSTLLTAHNGGIYGQDLTEVDATHFGCVATEKCTANANYTSQEPVLPDTQAAGSWSREVVQTSAGEGS
jgi:hypothetical protein